MAESKHLLKQQEKLDWSSRRKVMDNKVNTEETVLETAAAETEEKASAE